MQFNITLSADLSTPEGRRNAELLEAWCAKQRYECPDQYAGGQFHGVLESLRESLEASEMKTASDSKELIYDEWAGRILQGTAADINLAVANTNLLILESGYANLDDFYSYLGLEPSHMGEELGWSGKTINVRLGSRLSPDMRSMLSFCFTEVPRQGWRRG